MNNVPLKDKLRDWYMRLPPFIRHNPSELTFPWVLLLLSVAELLDLVPPVSVFYDVENELASNISKAYLMLGVIIIIALRMGVLRKKSYEIRVRIIAIGWWMVFAAATTFMIEGWFRMPETSAFWPGVVWASVALGAMLELLAPLERRGHWRRSDNRWNH
jgi:hypothetical protein